jgi:Cu/Ag efflux protein CusF
MRQWIPWVSFVLGVFVAGLARAQSNAAAEEKKYDTVEAVVVAVNPEDMTITVKLGDEEQTEKVSALAKARLSGVKAGEKVQLTRKEVAGKREVVSIRRPKEPARK